MQAALALAARARPLSCPNPGVAAIVVADGHVVGRGITAPGGRPHAEAAALAQAGDRARGADIYVTLEPCAHTGGRGPNCARTIVEYGIARVIIAVQDSDPRTDGKGIAILREAAIPVVTGICDPKARQVLAGFFSAQERGRPFVTLKLALSLDGCIAMADGRSQWITGKEARAHTHLERARQDAILVGGGTYRADNPALDVRFPGLEAQSPRRLLLTRGEAPDGWHRIAAPHDIGALADVHWLMVEGGAQTAAAFLRSGLVDRLLLYRAPIIIGGGLPGIADIGLENLDSAHGIWRCTDTRMLGKDRMESYERATAQH